MSIYAHQNNSYISNLLKLYSAYPSPIRPYLLKADTDPLIRSMFTKSGMLVLIDILGRAPIHDQERPIKLRVDKIASAINRSEKTVQRVLNALQSKEWLIRSADHDGRNYRGRFCYREFIVGNELRKMLGLPETKMSDGEQAIQDQSTGLPTKTVDNLIKIQKMSDGHRDVNKTRKEALKKEASFQKTESKEKSNRLPKDLIAMQEELNLSKGGICALMALASKCKKRLQDIWEVKKNTIRNAGVTQGRAFYYIKALIAAVDNFANVSTEKKNCFLGNKKITTNFREFWHKRYVGSNGLHVKIFDGIAEVHNSGKFRIVPSSDMHLIYEAIHNGKLRLILD